MSDSQTIQRTVSRAKKYLAGAPIVVIALHLAIGTVALVLTHALMSALFPWWLQSWIAWVGIALVFISLGWLLYNRQIKRRAWIQSWLAWHSPEQAKLWDAYFAEAVGPQSDVAKEVTTLQLSKQLPKKMHWQSSPELSRCIQHHCAAAALCSHCSTLPSWTSYHGHWWHAVNYTDSRDPLRIIFPATQKRWLKADESVTLNLSFNRPVDQAPELIVRHAGQEKRLSSKLSEDHTRATISIPPAVHLDSYAVEVDGLYTWQDLKRYPHKILTILGRDQDGSGTVIATFREPKTTAALASA